MKTTGPTKQEHARLEVENAEDDLVQKTEVAITLMKAVLDNVRSDLDDSFLFFADLPLQPEPIKNLNELIKAQVSARRPFLLDSQIITSSITATLLCIRRRGLKCGAG